MKLTIACSYCSKPMHLRIGDIESARRDAEIGKFTCASCDSVTLLEITTKRARKGAGMRRMEAEAQARLEASLAAQRALNARIGGELLAMPGCTCGPRIEARGPRLRNDGTLRNNQDDGGHPLVTSWSRDDKRGGMMPGVPQHFHGCPCRNTPDEERIRGAKEGDS